MRVVVTGAAGFIGSNLVRALHDRGIEEIVAVDDLSDGSKFSNLVGGRIADYLDVDEFYGPFESGALGHFDLVFHQGACSDTMQVDGRYMMRNNFTCSRRLLDACTRQGTRLVYASSASVYGGSSTFVEDPAFERPLNVYAYSKLLFDDVVRRRVGAGSPQVVGLRYFNVYGPRERHKGRMASVAFHHFHEFREKGSVGLFGPYGGYGAGQQQRDFVHVDDVVAVNLWFMDHPSAFGIFNVGTGRAQPFNDVAQAVVNNVRANQGLTALTLDELVEGGLLRYFPFPDALVGKYQCHTQADLSALRACGCDLPFADVATGVARYVASLSD